MFMSRGLSGKFRSGVAALAVVAAVGLVLAVAPAATAQSTPTLTVTPASIERPASGNKPVTLHFSHTGCDGCSVELDPGWLLPAADQAVKGKNGDFGAANYWSTNVIYGNKRGKGPVPDALGIKVRPGDGTRKFIRFTLNDSNSFVVAEAKVWLTPQQAPQPQQLQQPQQQQPQQPQQDEYQLQQEVGPAGQIVECWMSMAGGVPDLDGWMVDDSYERQWRSYRWGSEPGSWQTETVYVHRPLRSGERFRLEFSHYKSSANFDIRWQFVSVVDARTGAGMDGLGLPNNVQYPGGEFSAPSKSFTINYRVQQHGVQNGASNTCSITIAVR